MKKVSNVVLTIFSIGIIICLFAGGLSFLGYIVGLIVGGDTATNICTWVFKTYLPIVIIATSVFTGIGLIGMYFSRQKALTAKADKTDK